jgi:hypothetical protein
MARSLLRQLEQISGSFGYDDTLPMTFAENGGTLELDLNFLRSQLKVITGETNWFDAPNKTIVQLDTEDGYIDTFIGKAAGNDSPAYSSNVYVTDSTSLETAIGDLDAAIAGVADVAAPDKLVEDIVASIAAESAHTLPHGKIYTLDLTEQGLNLDVLVNGQALAVDSGSVQRDYDETSTSQVTFHFTVEENSNIVYVIRG